MRVNTATKARRFLPGGEPDISCYENLANAIIVKAVKDYKVELRKLLVNPKNREAMGKAMDLERFFYSPWYDTLTNVRPDTLLDGVRKQVKEEAEIKRRRRMERLRREAAQLQKSMGAAPHGAASVQNGTVPTLGDSIVPLGTIATPLGAKSSPLGAIAASQGSMPKAAAGVLCAE